MIGRKSVVLKPPHPFRRREGLTFPKLSQVTVEGVRHYQVGEEKYPSITTILSASKAKKKALTEWRARVGDSEANRIGRMSTSRGTALHKLCERYLKHSEVEVTSTYEKENFLKIKPFLDKRVCRVFAVEQAMYSHSLKIAGSCDLVADVDFDCGVIGVEEWPAVIDFKTSAKAKYKDRIHEYYIQGTAYAVMFEEMTGIRVPSVIIAITVEAEIYPQIFEVFTTDWIQPLNEAIAVYRESIHVQETNS